MNNPDKMRELEQKAHEDYRNHMGKVLLVTELEGHVGAGDSQEWNFDPPLRVRVTTTDPRDIEHWNDDWLDPYWNVEVLDTPPEDGRNFYIFGISYSTKNEVQRSRWELENAQS